MAWEPLVLKGSLKLGTGSGLTSGQLLDVSDQVYAMQILINRNTVEVPATLGQPRGTRAGGTQYSVKVDYLSAVSGSGCWQIFEAALAAADGIVCWEGRMTDASISATNPSYRGELIVTGAAIGGTAEELSTDSQTFPLVSSYLKSTS
jgi:hypothetical protein